MANGRLLLLDLPEICSFEVYGGTHFIYFFSYERAYVCKADLRCGLTGVRAFKSEKIGGQQDFRIDAVGFQKGG